MSGPSATGLRAEAGEYREARAFNRGSDDCLLGIPRGRNPYARLVAQMLDETPTELADAQALATAWQDGWDQARAEYGEDVGGRWPYLCLTAVVSRQAVYDHGSTWRG